MAKHRGNGDATGLDRQHLVHLYTFETAFQLVSNLTDNADVDLMVQEVVYLQNIALHDSAITQDSFFKEVHIASNFSSNY